MFSPFRLNCLDIGLDLEYWDPDVLPSIQARQAWNEGVFREESQALFRLLDVNHDGAITRKEIETYIRDVKYRVRHGSPRVRPAVVDSEVDEICEKLEIDRQRGGRITIVEFRAFFRSRYAEMISQLERFENVRAASESQPR
eukprot:PhM_4_TR17558/c1_g1_i1/m.42673